MTIKKIVLFLFFLNTTSLFGQNEAKDSIYNFENLDKEPVFAEGHQELAEFIKKNISYPSRKKKEKLQGTVYVQFIIEKNGSVGTMRILKGIATDYDNEVIEVVKKMPKWTPGEKNGKVVRTYFNLPVRFLN